MQSNQNNQNYLSFVPFDIIKKMTPIQKWRAFEKEVLAWFLRDNPSLAPFINLEAIIYGKDSTKPDGFSTTCFQYDYPGPGHRGFSLMNNLIKDTKDSIILKVVFSGVAGVSEEILQEFFNKYKACDKKMWSEVFNIPFEIGDGDDNGAVTYEKGHANYYIISIWLRHFR